MALGWQGEKVIYGHLGNWPRTDFVGNVRIDSIDRQENKIVVKGGTRLIVRNDPGWGQAWYQAPINVSVTGAPTVQAKPDTGMQVIDGRPFDTAFTSTINVSPEATSASITVRWDDTAPSHNNAGWVHWGDSWTITFQVAAKGPQGTITVTTDNPSVYRLRSWASGIDWGFGYSSASLTARVSYNIDGKSVNYVAYSSGGGASSASFDINAVYDAIPWNRVPDDETVTVTWTASTNLGSITGQATQYCMKSYDAFVIESGVNGGRPVAADVFISNSPGDRPNKEMRRVNTIG